MVSRDGDALEGDNYTYSNCYVDAFQTQPDGSGDRADLRSNWPSAVVKWSVLREWHLCICLQAQQVSHILELCANVSLPLVSSDLEDPNWPGEYLIDISTSGLLLRALG